MSTPLVPDSIRECLSRATDDARRRRHEYVTLEHLLLSLSDDDRAAEVLKACGARVSRLQAGLQEVLDAHEQLPQGVQIEPEQTLGLRRVLARAVIHAQSAEQEQIEAGDLLAAIFDEEESQARYLLDQQGVTRLAVVSFISHGPSIEGMPVGAEEGESESPLEAYTTDLVARAEEGKIDPLIGRDRELERMIQVLCRRQKNNPLLLGDPGVGKTALVEGLALRIHEGGLPEALAGAKIFAMDMGSLLAGTKFRGQFEERVKGVLRELEAMPNAILFIDEIQTLVGAGAASGGSVDGANMLKPALGRGDMRCIGSTTHAEFKALEKDRGLARRFQTIEVLEPSVDETVSILEGLKSRYEEHHGVTYTDEALRAAAELSAKHINERYLPDKAIDVLDEAGARERAKHEGRLDETGKAQVEAVVAAMARIPTDSVSTDDKARLQRMDEDLRKNIFGQEQAIESIVAAIRLARAGLRAPGKPVGSFLFFGPTGVGKTELARVLSRSLGVELLRYDMSEYSEKHTVSRLIGAPPGYVGFDQGGMLTDSVRRNPYSVVLLDEIEKAHPDLFNILLQVMDHATLTDNNGRKADFRNVILIMTTNAGARELTAPPIGFDEGKSTGDPAKKPLERMFSPEFRNRLDAVVRFDSLSTQVIEMIVDKQIGELKATLQAKGVEMELRPGARSWLAEHGYDRLFGARPMGRLIDEKVRKPLAEAMLFGDLSEGGGRVVVDVDDDGLVVTASGGKDG
jgi:ATP-dependent Clp protease ATP-binding subunit ClpA